jgi:oleandomycin transport system ATP-binding protein
LTGQYASVDEDLTGIQNLVLIGNLLNLSGRDAKARGLELLEWFGLADAAQRRAKTPIPAVCAAGSTSPPVWWAGRG